MTTDFNLFVSDAEIEAVKAPLEEASLLPLQCYGNQAFHEFECEKVFMDNWICAGRTDQVANPGDYYTRQFFTEPVLITKDETGEIHALSNVCRHRAREVAEGSGNCQHGAFRCPYHAWTYNLDGSLREAPHMEETAHFNIDDISLPKLALELWQGFIWINFAENPKPLAEQLSTLDKALEGYDLANMKCFEFVDYEGKWDWKVTLENFTEAYHQPPIHTKTFEPWCPATLAEYDDNDGPYNLFWMPTGDGNRFPTTFPPIDGLKDDYYKCAWVINVFPHFHLLIDSSSVIWLDWDIKGPEQHQLIWRVLVPESTSNLPDFEDRIKQLLKDFRPVWHEDEYACGPVNTGQKSRYATAGRLSHMEKSVHQLHNWLITQYEK